MVSQAVTAAISALFQRTEQLEANVRAEPVTKLLQGSVDGFDFIGQGLLMYSGLRVQAMELYVQAVSIDFGAVFRGQIKLRQPTQATMRIVLTEEDLTASFNTQFLKDKLQKIEYQGKPLYFQNTGITLNDDGSLRLQTQVCHGKAAEGVPIDVIAYLKVEERRKIQFVDVEYKESGNNPELAKAVIDHLNNLLDLDQFALDGLELRVDQLRLRNKKLTFYGIAHIRHFPQRAGK